MEAKLKCSGKRCPMQHNAINVSECKCAETCEWYTPIKGSSGMEVVIDMAAKQFGLERESDKQKLKILFNAYLTQYISYYFPLDGGG